jgi:hypothetical protein
MSASSFHPWLQGHIITGNSIHVSDVPKATVLDIIASRAPLREIAVTGLIHV